MVIMTTKEMFVIFFIFCPNSVCFGHLLTCCPLHERETQGLLPKPPGNSNIFSHINDCVLTTVPPQAAGQVKVSMPECYTAAAPDLWPGSVMSACPGTVLPLSFTEDIQTPEGVSFAENAIVKWIMFQQRAKSMSGTDPYRRLYTLPHRDGSCKSNLLSRQVPVY